MSIPMNSSLCKAIVRELKRSRLPLSVSALCDRLEAMGYRLDEASMRRAGESLIAARRIVETGVCDSAGHMCWRLTTEDERNPARRTVPGDGLGLDDATSARFHALDAEVVRELEDDARFFRAHPERLHRIRRAFAAEAQQAAMLMRAEPLGTGLTLLVAVERHATGKHLRVFLPSVADPPADVPERSAAAIYAMAMQLGGLARERETLSGAAYLDALIGGR